MSGIDAVSYTPLDVYKRQAQETGAIVTAEEHSVIGGLGGAVAEVLSEQAPAPLVRVGVKDVFGESAKPGELFEKYGLTAKDCLLYTSRRAAASQNRRIQRPSGQRGNLRPVVA